jgi:hypothetical protein
MEAEAFRGLYRTTAWAVVPIARKSTATVCLSSDEISVCVYQANKLSRKPNAKSLRNSASWRAVSQESYDEVSFRVRGMKDDADTIANLRAHTAAVMAIVPYARPQDADRGQIEFLLNCAGCHGTDAKGSGPQSAPSPP